MMSRERIDVLCSELQLVMAYAYEARIVAALQQQLAQSEQERGVLIQTLANHQCHAAERDELAQVKQELAKAQYELALANKEREAMLAEKEPMVKQMGAMMKQLEQLTEEVKHKTEAIKTNKMARKTLHAEMDLLRTKTRQEMAKAKEGFAHACAEIKRLEKENEQYFAELSKATEKISKLKADLEEYVERSNKVPKLEIALEHAKKFAKERVHHNAELMLQNDALRQNIIVLGQKLELERVLKDRDHRDLISLITIYLDKSVPYDSPSKEAMMANEIARIKREPLAMLK